MQRKKRGWQRRWGVELPRRRGPRRERLGPGVYLEDERVVLLSVPEMLEAQGLPDTAANRARLGRQLAAAVRGALPEARCRIEGTG